MTGCRLICKRPLTVGDNLILCLANARIWNLHPDRFRAHVQPIRCAWLCECSCLTVCSCFNRFYVSCNLCFYSEPVGEEGGTQMHWPCVTWKLPQTSRTIVASRHDQWDVIINYNCICKNQTWSKIAGFDVLGTLVLVLMWERIKVWYFKSYMWFTFLG